jgi:hypothetical protein
MDHPQRYREIKAWLAFFIIALAISGITAIPLGWEIDLLMRWFGPGTWFSAIWPAMAEWIGYVHSGLTAMIANYPFLQYGTDWLAFAHIVLAIAFVGAWRDPVRNIWVIEFGMIACVLVIPTAFIFGGLRGIPFYWRLIDCAFGVFGIIPLWIVREKIKNLEWIR